MIKKIILFTAVILFAQTIAWSQQRIVSLNGAMSEILCALGMEKEIVAVDLASNYPSVLASKPKVGLSRTVSAEGVLSFRPTLIVGADNEIPTKVIAQLKNSKVSTAIIHQQYNYDGIYAMILKLGELTGKENKANELVDRLKLQLKSLKITPINKKVLFIYARGAGAMSVAGKNTSLHEMIQLAGAKNVMAELDGFKPLTTEALIKANPDVILLFNMGFESLGGLNGILEVPGIKLTNAGKHKKIIQMDAQLLSGFGLRTPEAIQILHEKLKD